MADLMLRAGQRSFAAQLADAVRDTRRLIGWTQRELADRALTSHTTIWRIERGQASHIDLLVVERVLHHLGLRATLSIARNPRHLDDRRRQADGVHARIVGHVARRLERSGWLTSLEVPLGEGVPRGWIDLLAYREADDALLVDEAKTDLPDMGALGRSLGFYARSASEAAHALGWRPRRLALPVTALDSAAFAERLADNRSLVARMLPAPVPELARWLADPRCAQPLGWGLGMVDPATRGPLWLRPTMLGSRRRPAAYTDYADAAARLRARTSS